MCDEVLEKVVGIHYVDNISRSAENVLLKCFGQKSLGASR